MAYQVIARRAIKPVKGHRHPGKEGSIKVCHTLPKSNNLGKLHLLSLFNGTIYADLMLYLLLVAGQGGA